MSILDFRIRKERESLGQRHMRVEMLVKCASVCEMRGCMSSSYVRIVGMLLLT